jgi:enterochelin esterase family protein
LLFLLVSVAAHAQAPPALPQRVLSPEVAADGRVTFRIRAPQAEMVGLGGDLPLLNPGQTFELRNGGDGVWQRTVGPLDPGVYCYTFIVDGVSVVDPAQPKVCADNDNVSSLFMVPGAEFMDTLDVPHGAVAKVTYFSRELGKHRRMHVYTPPDYGLTRQRYPVLYLLHGATGSDAQWSTVGRAGDILDNLIAANRAAPMVVVMPAGHTGSFSMGPLDELARGFHRDPFLREFQRDIKPYVESHYAVRTDRKSTAIAGLSMGGIHTIEIVIADLAGYGYIGVFSSGVWGAAQSDDWGKLHQAQLDDAGAKAGLELLWFATGKDDFVLENSKATAALFERHGFDVTFVESAGGHTWRNWREYLHEFAPQLFK